MKLIAEVNYIDASTGEKVMTYTVDEEKQYFVDGGIAHEFPNNCIPSAWTPVASSDDNSSKAVCSPIRKVV